MKASELIELLKKMIQEHGDCICVSYLFSDGRYDDGWKLVEVEQEDGHFRFGPGKDIQ